ncbi:MAG: RNA methyltransferase [Acidobacteria bacterium]|nr:RNA methyltransferase [Acidobacteriota bacterium]
MGRNEQRIHASVTQVDLHDFCRLARTYGLEGFHCVTAIDAQHEITADLAEYWQKGPGSNYNPDRREALSLLEVHRTFDEVLEKLRRQYGADPVVVGTSARSYPEKSIDFEGFWGTIAPLGRPVLIQFGTSWGLSPEQMSRCDWVLPPIVGRDGYNHLSVRCAAAILIDRLMGASTHGST